MAMMRRDHRPAGAGASDPRPADPRSIGSGRPTTPGRRREPTVRLIAPEDQPAPGPDGRFGLGIDHELLASAQRLADCREAAARAASALREMRHLATEARERAERAQRAFQEARDDARRADLALRRHQRRAADAKLELRRALEWAARLEGSRPVEDATSYELGDLWVLQLPEPSADDTFGGDGCASPTCSVCGGTVSAWPIALTASTGSPRDLEANSKA